MSDDVDTLRRLRLPAPIPRGGSGPEPIRWTDRDAARAAAVALEREGIGRYTISDIGIGYVLVSWSGEDVLCWSTGGGT